MFQTLSGPGYKLVIVGQKVKCRQIMSSICDDGSTEGIDPKYDGKSLNKMMMMMTYRHASLVKV